MKLTFKNNEPNYPLSITEVMDSIGELKRVEQSVQKETDEEMKKVFVGEIPRIEQILENHWRVKFMNEDYLKKQFKSVTKKYPNEFPDTWWDNYLEDCENSFKMSCGEMLKKIKDPNFVNTNPDGLFREIFYFRTIDVYNKKKIKTKGGYDTNSYENLLHDLTHAFDDSNFLKVTEGLEENDFVNAIKLIPAKVQANKLACMEKCKRTCALNTCQKNDSILNALNAGNQEEINIKLQHTATEEQKWKCYSFCKSSCESPYNCLKHQLVMDKKRDRKSYEELAARYHYPKDSCKAFVDRYCQSIRGIYEDITNMYLK